MYFNRKGGNVIDVEGMQYLAENLDTRPSVTGFLIDILVRQEMISPMNAGMFSLSRITGKRFSLGIEFI